MSEDVAGPDAISPITIEDLDRLGINGRNVLFWDGKELVVRRRLDLTSGERLIAIVVSLAAILGGIGAFATGWNDASEFLCKRGHHLLSCPAAEVKGQEPTLWAGAPITH